MKQRCLVLDKVGSRLLVSASDFDFRWIPASRAADAGASSVEPGDVVWLELQDVAASTRQRSRTGLALRILAVAAAVVVLIAAVTWTQVGQAWYVRLARGYLAKDRTVVALDINPSLELYMDDDGVVRAGLGLNRDGREIVRELHYGVPVEELLEQLMTQLEQQQYLTCEPAALMVSAVQASEQVRERVEAAVARCLQQRRVNVMTVFQKAERAQWEHARRKGQSLNGLLLAERARQYGIDVDPEAPIEEQLDTLGISGQRHGILAPEQQPGPKGPGGQKEPGPGGKQQSPTGGTTGPGKKPGGGGPH